MDLRALAGTAAAYVVLHHLGLVPDGFGSGPRGTRWADWLDLASVLATAGGIALVWLAAAAALSA